MHEEIQQEIVRLNKQVDELYYKGQYKQAMDIATRARDLARQYLGKEHPDFGQCLNNLAGLYLAMGNCERAELLFQQALEIRRIALGDTHLAVAESLNNLAALYREMGKYAKALPLLKQVLEIERTTLGEEHPDFVISLSNLASLYYSMGNDAKALPLFQQVLEMHRTLLEEEDPDFALSLHNLAGQYKEMGDYVEAKKLYQQAVEINRKALGEVHPDFATTLNNLAGLYKDMGDYAKAEPLLKQGLEIRRRVFGEMHPYVARSLNDLAELHATLGDYTKSEPLYQKAGEIYRTVLGEEHPDVAISLNNLAILYKSIGKYTEAEPLYHQALEIRRKVFGEMHPYVAQSLNDLAILYYAMDNYTKAETLHQQALEIDYTIFGEEHPDFSTSLNNLAFLYKAMGNYAKAGQLYKQALEIDGTTLGQMHPEFATSLNNLAVLYVATQREGDAMTLKEQAEAINDKMIGEVFSFGSESQRMAYLKTLQQHFNIFLSLVFQYLSYSSTAVHAGLERVLRRKGIGAEALLTQRDAFIGNRYPALAPKLRELTTLRMQIAQKTLAGPGPEDLSAHQKLLAEWNTQKEELEAFLARQIPEMNLEQKLRAVNRQTVALALPKESVLVEFVRFDVYDFKAVVARGEPQWKPARYFAFVLHASEPDDAQMIDLGEAEPIDQMLASFRASITGELESYRGEGAASPQNQKGEKKDSTEERDDSKPARFGRPESAVKGAASTVAGIALRQAVFDPLMEALGGCKRLFLAPEGDLSRLPFEVLPALDGGHLIDNYQISYLSTGRDVLRFKAAFTGKPKAPLVAASPDFELGDDGEANSEETSPSPGRRSRDLSHSKFHFSRLPGTRVEGERIAAMLGVKPLLEERVLESQIKGCRSPRILHIATHGFFLPDQKRNPNKDIEWIGEIGSDRMKRLAYGLENPLLRSGLALAGANTWLKGGYLPIEAEDGILTAEDVSGLDLLDTELVVLSACETGLGEVQIGEGIFGLRRSFVLAGAKTLVMSLWKVPDQQTQELMENFYRRILEGQPRADALRAAQLAMKERYSDPLYWGAFICQGDPSPLP